MHIQFTIFASETGRGWMGNGPDTHSGGYQEVPPRPPELDE